MNASRRLTRPANRAARSTRQADLARRGNVDRAPGAFDRYGGLGRDLAVDADPVVRPGIENHVPPAPLGHGLVAVAQLEQRGEPAPGEAHEAPSRHRLNDHFAAVEAGI